MPDSKAATRTRVRDILAALEKIQGKVHPLEGEPPLDHAVYLLLRENWDYRKAQRALHVMQKEFVDWNEIRVTTNGELKSLLHPLGDKDIDVKLEKIRTLLDGIYKERNVVHLNFLKEGDPERQGEYLTQLGVLTPAQVQILVQSMTPPAEWGVPPAAIRVLGRIGLLPRVYSPSSARKHVDEMVEGPDLQALLVHLVQHGEEVCQLKSPRCSDCSIVTWCGFKRKVGIVGKPR